VNKNKSKTSSKIVVPASLKEAVQGRQKTTAYAQSVLGIDINKFKHSIDLLKYSLDYADAIVNTVREPLVVLNKELNVITANRSFYQSFNIVPDKVENRPFYELGE